MMAPNYQGYGGSSPPSTTKSLLRVAPNYGDYPAPGTGGTGGTGGGDTDSGLPGSTSYPSNFVNNLEQPAYKHYPLPILDTSLTGGGVPTSTPPGSVMVSALVQPTSAAGSAGAPSTPAAMLLTPTPKPPAFAPAGTVAIGVTTLPGAAQPAPFAIVPTTTNAPPKTAAIALMTLPGALQPASFALVPILTDSTGGATTPPTTGGGTTTPPTTGGGTTTPPTTGGGTTTPPTTGGTTPPVAVDVFDRQPAYNPAFHGERSEEKREEAITHDGLPVSFTVPAGCNAVDLSMGPIEVSPQGNKKDLDHVIMTGKWRVVDGDDGSPVDEAAVEAGQHINVIVPWRTRATTRIAAGNLRAFVFAHFYAKQIETT